MNVHRPSSSRNGQSSTRSSTSPGLGDHQHSSSEYTATYKGVRYRSEQNKWVAEIRPPKSSRTWWLGTYSTPIEAAYAYDVAITYFRSETSLNFNGNPFYDQIPRISPDLPNQDFASELRKVVKEYGKRAMQSDDPTSQPEEEEEDVDEDDSDEEEDEDEDQDEEEEEASESSFVVQDQYTSSSPPNYDNFYDHQQEEMNVVNQSSPNFVDSDQTIGWDDIPFPEPGFPTDQTINPNYDAPFDFDIHPVAYENNYNLGAYQPAASDYDQPASSGMMYGYNHAMSGYSEPCGYFSNGFNQPQVQQSTYSAYNQYYNSY